MSEEKVWFALQVNPVSCFLSKRDSPLVGGSRVPGEKRGDLCGIGGFQEIYQTLKKESILARGFLRGKPFDSTSMRILWEYFGFKETSLDVKDCRIEPEFVQKDEPFIGSVPYLALA